MFDTLSVLLTQPPVLLGLFIATVVLLLITFLSFETKRFYLIRHGRTFLNEKKIKQGAEGDLSPAGIEQAHVVGTYLAKIGMQALYSSPYPRARQTAEVIQTHMPRVPVFYSDLFRERKNPTEVLGKRTDDPEVEKIVDTIDLGYHEDDYRFSDEENFTDLVQRARQALVFLEHRNHASVCVVTHHAFLKMLLAHMLYRKNLHAVDFIKLSYFNQSDNGGITICEYRPFMSWFSPTGGWTIVSYNEQLS